ncbi:MAG: TetR/AcrR family transcriptional regulator [Filifactoraceae bacterium]
MSEINIKVPRQVKSQKMKNHIFETAMTLLKNHGYQYVTVNNVCVSANVSVGSFYHYFSSKDELLSYYFVAGYEKYRQDYEEKQTEDFIKNICMIYSIYTRFCVEQGINFIKNFYTPGNKSLNIRDIGVKDERRLPTMQKSYLELENAYKKGHILASVDILQIAEDLCVLEKGCIFEWALCDGRYELQENSYRMIKTLLNGITTEKYKVDTKIF